MAGGNGLELMSRSGVASGTGSIWTRAWPVLKWLLFAVVLIFVGRRAWHLWEHDRAAVSDLRIRFSWLVSAAAVYLLGWLPAVWFWRALMRRLGGVMSFRDTMRAYYCGHLGKYVPGKAAVLVIRSGMMKDRGISVAAVAVTAAVETLLMMAAGAALAVAFSPLLLPRELPHAWPSWIRGARSVPLLPAAVVVLAVLAALPVIARVLTQIAVRMMPRGFLEGRQAVEIDAGLIGRGLLTFGASWLVHGLSLGLVIRGVSSGPVSLLDWPAWSGAVALATVGGFVAIVAPGGIGVREGILIEVLRMQPGTTAQTAVAAAVMLRIVWFLAEIAAAAGVYYLLRKPSEKDEYEPSDDHRERPAAS